MKLDTGICATLRVYSNNFGDPLTLSLASAEVIDHIFVGDSGFYFKNKRSKSPKNNL